MPRTTLHHSMYRLTPISRYVTCPLCGYRMTVPRRGLNALAACSRLTGMYNRHLAQHAEHDERPEHRPSPLESSPDAAGEWSIDAAMAERAEREED